MAIAAPNTSDNNHGAGYRAELRRSSGYGDYAFLHVGIPYLLE